jgi:hypothetical protein
LPCVGAVFSTCEHKLFWTGSCIEDIKRGLETDGILVLYSNKAQFPSFENTLKFIAHLYEMAIAHAAGYKL